MKLFNKYSPSIYRAEYVSGKVATGVNNQQYGTFITQMTRELERGKRVYLYFNYQVTDIKEIYKEEVEITYNKTYNWWEAILHKYKVPERNKKGGN